MASEIDDPHASFAKLLFEPKRPCQQTDEVQVAAGRAKARLEREKVAASLTVLHLVHTKNLM